MGRILDDLSFNYSSDITKRIFDYPRSNFTHYFLTGNETDVSVEDHDLLILLGEDWQHGKIKYYMHYFSIQNELSWMRKVLVDLDNNQIRDHQSFFGYHNAKFLFFIDKSQKQFLITNEFGKLITKYKMKNAIARIQS